MEVKIFFTSELLIFHWLLRGHMTSKVSELETLQSVEVHRFLDW